MAAMNTFSRQFKDVATYNQIEKSAISVRDGVIEYLGAELNVEPKDKVYKVFRSSATIANAAMKMSGIPLTNEHISLDMPAPDTGSYVEEAFMVDLFDDETNTKIAIKNRLKLTDGAAVSIQDRHQLSLGYMANLVPHNVYDFEQTNIMPHHLAMVVSGRCGALCSFLDSKKSKLEKKDMPELKDINQRFLDEKGELSLEQIVEIVLSLPDAIKMIPINKLHEVMPALQEIISIARGEEAESDDEELEEEEALDGEDDNDGDESKEIKDKVDDKNEDQKEIGDESEEDKETDESKPEKVKRKVKDKKKSMKSKDGDDETDNTIDKRMSENVEGQREENGESEEKKKEKKYKDEAFLDAAVKKEVAKYAVAFEKARHFLDETYNFSDKSTMQIMRDTLAVESTEQFSDEEIPLAFRLLKRNANYINFGKTQSINDLIDEIAKKEL